MKISHIKIQNYRNVQDVDLDFSKVAVIASENNRSIFFKARYQMKIS